MLKEVYIFFAYCLARA